MSSGRTDPSTDSRVTHSCRACLTVVAHGTHGPRASTTSSRAKFTVVTDGTHRLFWRLSVAIMLLITAADAFLGSRVILIGLLMIGPCCRALQRTAGLDRPGRGHRCRPGIVVGPTRRDLGYRGAVRLHRSCLDGCDHLHMGSRDHGIGDQALNLLRDVMED